MIGTTMEEIKDKVFTGHEVEFTYNDCDYTIELSEDKGVRLAEMWKMEEVPIRVAKCVVKTIDDLDLLFGEKCFEGKAFFDIEQSVIVTIMY